jgi:hypothetical protein
MRTDEKPTCQTLEGVALLEVSAQRSFFQRQQVGDLLHRDTYRDTAHE